MYLSMQADRHFKILVKRILRTKRKFQTQISKTHLSLNALVSKSIIVTFLADGRSTFASILPYLTHWQFDIYSNCRTICIRNAIVTAIVTAFVVFSFIIVNSNITILVTIFQKPIPSYFTKRNFAKLKEEFAHVYRLEFS